MSHEPNTVAKRRRLPVYLLFGSATALALNAGRLTHSAVPGPTPTVPPVPYTVTLRETLHRSGASPMYVTTFVYALRDDGSQVSRKEFLDAPYGRQLAQRYIRFASGAAIQIDEIRERKTSMFIRKFTVGRNQRDPASNCLKDRTGQPLSPNEIPLGEEHVGSWRAVKVAIHNGFSWFSLDAGCALVNQRVDIKG